MPRPHTAEEVRSEFLDHVAAMVRYWDELPDIDRATGNVLDQRGRIEGIAFTILSALDGSSMALPAFVVAPCPHPEDKADCIANGSNYYHEAPKARCDIAGGLHGLLHQHFAKFPRRV